MKQMTIVGRTVTIISGLLMILACILYIVSNGLPLWGRQDLKEAKGTFGLWRLCAANAESIYCSNLPLTCSHETSTTRASCFKMIFARVFITLACLVSAISAACLFACIVIKTGLYRIIIIIAKILPLISLIVGIIGVALGIAFATQSPLNIIGEAAILGITAVAVNIIGAIVALMIR